MKRPVYLLAGSVTVEPCVIKVSTERPCAWIGAFVDCRRNCALLLFSSIAQLTCVMRALQESREGREGREILLVIDFGGSPSLSPDFTDCMRPSIQDFLFYQAAHRRIHSHENEFWLCAMPLQSDTKKNRQTFVPKFIHFSSWPRIYKTDG